MENDIYIEQMGPTGPRQDSAKPTESEDRGRKERLDALLEKIEPYMKDLVWQGSIVRKDSRQQNGPYVLQFRENLTGKRNGRSKRIYIGPENLAKDVMEHILRRAKAEGAAWPHWNRSRNQVVRERLGGREWLKPPERERPQPSPEHTAMINQRIDEFIRRLKEEKARAKWPFSSGRRAQI